MEKERFWFGAMMVAVPVVCLLLLLTPSMEGTRSAPVEGHVSIHGRPMSGGYIFFVPEGSILADSAVGWIDENGHYMIGPRWLRNGAQDETRFRICLIPRPRPASREGSKGPDRAGAAEASARAGYGAIVTPEVGRLSDPKTSHLEVRLDGRPAHVDIAL